MPPQQALLQSKMKCSYKLGVIGIDMERHKSCTYGDFDLLPASAARMREGQFLILLGLICSWPFSGNTFDSIVISLLMKLVYDG